MLKEYLVAKAFEVLETFIAENWDEFVELGRDGLQRLIAVLKERLGLPVPVMAADAAAAPLCEKFGCFLDDKLTDDACDPCDKECNEDCETKGGDNAD